MAKKVFTDESLSTFVDEIKSYTDEAVSTKANSNHTHAISNITNLQSTLDGKVPTSRAVNGKVLSADVTLSASDVGAAASGHTHDDRYYTESEINSKLSEKANISHGNHVPTTQTASNKVFLRNDNTWATVTPANIGAAASSHTHTVANISDLTTTATELNYMDGVTSSVQTQLDGKAASGHSHSAATTSANGFMTSAMVTKLNGIATGANAYTHPTTSGNKHIPSGGSSGQILRWAADGTAAWGADNNTTYTLESFGVYASGDELSMLEGIEGNVQQLLNEKAPGDHSHSKSEIVSALGYTPPTQDTVYTHPAYTARTGKPTANQTPGFGGTATVSQITSDASGHVTGATDRTITIPSTLSNGTGTAGLIKTSSTVTSSSGYTACPVINGVPYYKDTDTTYSLSSFGITATAAELNYTDGVTSNIQTQLDSLQGNMADSISTISGLQSSFSEHLTDYSSHTHEAADITSGTLGVARGGTGRATLTSGYFLRGNGTSAVTQTKPASVRSAIGVTEGTWTPSFHGGGSPTVVATGRYLKSGNLVIVHFYVNVTGTLSGSASSYIYLDGLPYAPDFSDGSVWYSGGGCFQGGTPIQASGTFSGYQISNTGYIYPRVTYVSGGINAQDYYNRKPASGANIHMAGTIMYYTAG